MSRPLLAVLLLAAACANKEAPSSTSSNDSPDAATTRTEAPPIVEVTTPSDDDGAACAPGEALLLKETRTTLSGAMPAMETLVYDNGHWALTGPSGKTGCLDEAQLADVKAALDAAEIAAEPLPPDMARCMAMPIHEVTVEAKGQRASWKAPCGPSNPSASLSDLQKKVAALTSG